MDMGHSFLAIENYSSLIKMGVRFPVSHFCWVRLNNGGSLQIMPNTSQLAHLCYVQVFPAITVDELLGILPVHIFRYGLRLNLKGRQLEYADGDDVLITFSYGGRGACASIIDAAYEALVWIYKNNYA